MPTEVTDVLLAACRWLVDVGLFGLLGVCGTRVVAARLHDTGASHNDSHKLIRSRLPRVARIAALTLLFGWAATVVTQIDVWFGAEGFTDPASIRTMLLDTRWGHGWLAAAATAVLAIMAARGAAARQWISIATALAAAIATTQVGHAAGRGMWIGVLHAGHILGAGLWLGTLSVLAWSMRDSWRHEDGAAIIGPVFAAFTPVALAGATLAGTTGALLTLEHVVPLTAILQSTYGVTLLMKLAGVAAMLALGAMNWRWLRPRIHLPTGRRDFRRAIVAEAAIGVLVVLVITAWLSGLAPGT